MKQYFIAMFVAIFAFAGVIPEADARRLGGGSSFGMQRQATPPAPRQPAAAPQQNLNRPAQGQQPAAAGGRSWMGPVAGLAAGLGLAALFSHLGLGEELGSLLLIALLAFAAFMLFRMFTRRAAGAAQGARPMQFATQGAHGASGMGAQQPFSAAAGSSSAAPAPIHASDTNASTLPADFDAEGFARQAKVQFIRLQAAHDTGNLDDIGEYTTPEVFAEIRMQMAERGQQQQRTDVVELNAEVVEVAEETQRYIVSVRFNGLLREEADAAPVAFDEIWHLTKNKDGNRGWVIAGIQQIA